MTKILTLLIILALIGLCYLYPVGAGVTFGFFVLLLFVAPEIIVIIFAGLYLLIHGEE